MKKITIFATLACAALITASTASAQPVTPPRTPVAGFSTNLADPQPETKATLKEDANRLIRWQGWLDVDAFSASILEQMQKQVSTGAIEVGTFTTAEPSIREAVVAAKAKHPEFIMNERLKTGEELKNPELFVWTYRHNYTDTGLYQLYISVKGTMPIGSGHSCVPYNVPHRDIQSLGYEFGGDPTEYSNEISNISAVVEIWRGAVVRVNAKGALELVGNEAGVVVGPLEDEAVEAAPIADWEKAPRLQDNARNDINENYKPKSATGAEFVEPLERAIPIHDNGVQKAPGDVGPAPDGRQDVQQLERVRTLPVEKSSVPPNLFRYRFRASR